jgi:prevent-host-death family protein
MKTVVISDFKAKCISVLNEAQRTGEPVLVTRRGKPIARVEPVTDHLPLREFGAYRNLMKVHGDIVYRDTTEDWDDQ